MQQFNHSKIGLHELMTELKALLKECLATSHK